MTVRDALTDASTRIARRDAETLLAHVLDRERPWLLAHPEAEVHTLSAAVFTGLLKRRAQGEPLQYLTGVQEFYGLTFHVAPGVLIPRPETELLVEAVLTWAAQPATHAQPTLQIADIGTGSGAIALALAFNLRQASLFATDLSTDALAIARENTARLALQERVRFAKGDLLTGFGPQLQAGLRFDAIVSNPPYIPTGDAAGMQREVVDHEPHTALFAGEHGLDVYRRLIPAAAAALRPGGLLALEIGFGQRTALTNLLEGWQNIRFLDDYAAIPRIALATNG